MTFRSLTTLLSALAILVAPLSTVHAGVVSKSKWEREFQFGRGDTLAIQVFHLKDGKPESITDEAYTLTGSGYATVAGERVKLGGLNMFSALASLESAFRRDSFAIGLETQVQISRQNGREIVFVDGEVNRPGIVTINDDATVADLIEAAGGVRESGDLERISITRNGTTLLVGLLKSGDTKVMAGAVVKVSRSLMSNGGATKRRFDKLGEDAKPRVDRLKGE